MLDKVIKSVAAVAGSTAGVLLAGYLQQKPIHPSLAKAVGVVVGATVTVAFDQTVQMVCKLSRLGRWLFDQQSVYHGAWLEDFDGQILERPYSIVRFRYNMDTRQYTVGGKTFSEAGDFQGRFDSHSVALDFPDRTMAAAYTSWIRPPSQHMPTEDIQGEGHSEFKFDGSSFGIATGSGKTFGRGNESRALQFRMIRLSKRFVRDELGLQGIRIGLDLDLDARAERAIVRAYHSWRQKQHGGPTATPSSEQSAREAASAEAPTNGGQLIHRSV